MRKITGRSSAVIVIVWGTLNLGLLVTLMGFGGGSFEGGAAGGACTLIGLCALALFLTRRREIGTTVVQPLGHSGWAAFFLALALALLGMALPFGAWSAVVAPVPLFVAGYLALAPRKGTRPTLSSATARVIDDAARSGGEMDDEARARAYLATVEAGVEGLSPGAAQAMLTRPAPPPSFDETARSAHEASGARAADEARSRRRRRRSRLARAGRAASAGLAAVVVARRRRKNRRSWE